MGLWWRCSSARGTLSLSSEEKSLGLFFHCGPEVVLGQKDPDWESHLDHLLCDFGQIARNFSNLAPQL